MTHRRAPCLPRRRVLCGCAAVAALAIAGCDRGREGAATGPKEIDAGASCSLDGMLLADFPGPKGQIQFADAAEVQWFCDTLKVLSTLLAPEQVRPVRAAWVQDMARADWKAPRGHWIDAKKAYYVLGSRRRGSMGPTAASFGEEAPAQAFAAEWGGRVVRYADLKPDMVDLTGGALHDQKM